MSNVINYNERAADYCGYRPAAIKLMAKIRKYWNDRGFDPQLDLIEEEDHLGKKLFSIRSDIPTSGPNRMTRL